LSLRVHGSFERIDYFADMSKGYDLPLHVAEAVKREAGDDAVLWVGRPDARRIFRTTALIWLFGVPWTGFVLIWEGIALAPLLSPWLISAQGLPKTVGAGSVFMALWGVPFLLVGLLIMSAPWWARSEAVNSAYVVTERYLMAVNASRSGTSTVEKTDISRIVTIVRTEWPSGFGVLKISRGRKRDSDGDLVSDEATWTGIPDVRRVEGIISALMDKRHANA